MAKHEFHKHTRSENNLKEQGKIADLPHELIEELERNIEEFPSVEEPLLDSLIERIGNSRIVLIGESTHGTCEFYKMRAKITQTLIEKKGFNIVGIEGDWPDTATLNAYIQNKSSIPFPEKSFDRFPTWMWRNKEMMDFLEWTRHYNLKTKPSSLVGIYGLDLYSLYTSINTVIETLDTIDPDLSKIARERYACFDPLLQDCPNLYTSSTHCSYLKCEEEVVSMFLDLFSKSMARTKTEIDDLLWQAFQNSRVIMNAEHYYRMMYENPHECWNLRDKHMFQTLRSILEYRGPKSKAVIWAHNSHVGNAAATEMLSKRGEYNIGYLCKQVFKDKVYLIGFGTDHGTVAASTNWDGPLQFKKIKPSHPQSYEKLFHEIGIPNFYLPLKKSKSEVLLQMLSKPRLERAIGVIYHPNTELWSHYFEAVLPHQFDEYIWMDETKAIHPLTSPHQSHLEMETWPFSL